MNDEQVYTVWVGASNGAPRIGEVDSFSNEAMLRDLCYTTKGKKSDWDADSWPPVKYEITIRRKG